MVRVQLRHMSGYTVDAGLDQDVFGVVFHWNEDVAPSVDHLELRGGLWLFSTSEDSIKSASQDSFHSLTSFLDFIFMV
jgi:hypothetical protein